MHIELRSTSEIKPYEQNPRLNDAAVEVVAKSLREFGFRQPIVVDADGVIIVGHTRLKAAQKLGLAQVPVHVATDLTPAQVTADVRLVRYLEGKYPTIRYLIGHHEYRVFEGHPLWLERDTAYRTAKSDPGPAFMAAVRAGVADLHLQGPPAGAGKAMPSAGAAPHR